MSDNRPSVYYEGDVLVVRASALGQCVRNLAMVGAGLTPEMPGEIIQQAWADGTRLEEEIIERGGKLAGVTVWQDYELKGKYGRVGDDGQVETEIVAGDRLVRCHLDGLGTVKVVRDNYPPPLTNCVIEAKAFSPGMYEKYKREGIEHFPFYSWQLAVEMVSTGLPALYIVAVKDDGEGDERGIDRVECTWYTKPPHSKMQIVARMKHIDAMIRQFERGEEIECDWKMYPCGFWKTHDKVKGLWAEEGGEIPAADMAGFTEWRDGWLKAREDQDDATVRVKYYKELLVEYMKRTGIKKSNRVTLVRQERKGEVNIRKLQEDKGITDEELDGYRSPGYVSEFVKVAKEKEDG